MTSSLFEDDATTREKYRLRKNRKIAMEAFRKMKMTYSTAKSLPETRTLLRMRSMQHESRWETPGCFERFIQDMGPPPGHSHEVDRDLRVHRVDHDLGFVRNNCVWGKGPDRERR